VRDVTVITASLPGREVQRAESIASVGAQTILPADHLVGIDYRREGGHRVRNLLASAVETTWTHILDDDDLLLPEHIETLLDHASGADIVYTYAQVIGDPNFDLYNRPFDPALLRQSSIVSHVAMIRTELLLDLGGWKAEKGYDWKLWVRALDAGAKFAAIPEKTWIYRLSPDWLHESRP
jgi:hypothetical protein